LEPYNVVARYMEYENDVLGNLGDDAPLSRPWIQDFTASYLGSGNYIRYGAHEVSEQIRALNEYGVDEFLLWNAGNTYSEGAQYSFD
ncbi:MAG: putative glycoside hydrolase, partial [Alkalibacterium sp.]